MRDVAIAVPLERDAATTGLNSISISVFYFFFVPGATTLLFDGIVFRDHHGGTHVLFCTGSGPQGYSLLF